MSGKPKGRGGEKQEEQRLGAREKRAYELWRRLVDRLASEVVPEDRIQIIVQQIQNYFKSINCDEGIKLSEKVLEQGESANVTDFDKVRALIHSHWLFEDALAHEAHSQDISPSFMVSLSSAQVLTQQNLDERIVRLW